jgi:hypothetical protein
MTFGRRPCMNFVDFECGANMIGTFFKEQMLANCSAECPAECSSIDFTFMQSFSKFPPASYLYCLLGQSDTLAQKYFNRSAQTFKNTMYTLNPSLVPSIDVLQSTLSGKLVALNVFYDDLVFTHIEESEKLSLIDLIAGLGGTLVN